MALARPLRFRPAIHVIRTRFPSVTALAATLPAYCAAFHMSWVIRYSSRYGDRTTVTSYADGGWLPLFRTQNQNVESVPLNRRSYWWRRPLVESGEYFCGVDHSLLPSTPALTRARSVIPSGVWTLYPKPISVPARSGMFFARTYCVTASSSSSLLKHT